MTTVDEAPASTTPDTAFRWDPTGQQWIFNINTQSAPVNVANQTYMFQILLNDSSTINFQFGLKQRPCCFRLAGARNRPLALFFPGPRLRVCLGALDVPGLGSLPAEYQTDSDSEFSQPSRCDAAKTGVPTPLPRLGGRAERRRYHARTHLRAPLFSRLRLVIWRNGNVRVLPRKQSGRQISGICCAHRDNRDARDRKSVVQG